MYIIIFSVIENAVEIIKPFLITNYALKPSLLTNVKT